MNFPNQNTQNHYGRLVSGKTETVLYKVINICMRSVPLIWGNQDTMWPVSKAALKHVPSKRLTFLAKPKSDCREKGLF